MSSEEEKRLQKLYYQANRKNMLRNQKKFADKNRGKLREYWTKYYLLNRDKILARSKRRRDEIQATSVPEKSD